jgi:hypothetical protein
MKIPAPWSEPSPPAHGPVAAGFVLIAAGMLTVARLGAVQVGVEAGQGAGDVPVQAPGDVPVQAQARLQRGDLLPAGARQQTLPLAPSRPCRDVLTHRARRPSSYPVRPRQGIDELVLNPRDERAAEVLVLRPIEFAVHEHPMQRTNLIHRSQDHSGHLDTAHRLGTPSVLSHSSWPDVDAGDPRRDRLSET